jgi:IS1 family transposase
MRHCTGRWESYSELLAPAKHWIGEEGTHHIGRNNLNFRTHLKRLRRQTVYHSREDDMREAVTKLYVRISIFCESRLIRLVAIHKMMMASI